jgi:hypothetical protein
MANIFYCPKCKKIEDNFQFDGREQRKLITWKNIRDGYGRPITHIMCPYCSYELSGFMNISGIKKDEELIEYVKYVIEGYSDNSYCDTELILNKIRNRCL